jgi:MFS family permease
MVGAEDDSEDDNEDHREGEQDPEILRERYQELLQELRVILPGVQVLFAFLLTTPFAPRFGDLDDVERTGYAITLAATLLSMIILLTPVAFHRLTSRQNRRTRVQMAIRFKLAGLAVLALAVSVAGFVVVRFVFGPVEGVLMGVGSAVAVLLLWVVFPLATRVTDHHHETS